MPSQRVLVAGAGPTGLLLAAELARREVPCTLIDAHDAPLGWDRATIVHSRSMQVFEALGIADRFLDRGVESPRVRIRSAGRQLAELDLGAVDTPYGFDLGISENVTEEILTGHLEARGGAVTRATRLVGLDEDADGVTVAVERDGESDLLRADWVVGCDGFHSTARRLAGIDFPGRDIPRPWAVFDATLDGWEEELEVQVAHLDVPPVILTPLPAGRWRVYLRPSSEESDLVADATAVIARYAPGVTPVDVENPVRFTCHSRIAATYRAGRLLLAGDAAHACTPAEGHGMNTGIQDAFNLGWKLALVCRGDAGVDLLDTYEAERRPVAELVVGSGEDVEGAQALTRVSDREERDAAIAATFADPDAAHHEAVAASELDRSYAGSPIVAGEASGGVAPGDLLPETEPVRPPDGDEPPLHALAHRPGHTVLILGGPAADPVAVAGLAAKLRAEFEDSPVVEAVVALASEPQGEAVGLIAPAVAERLGIAALTVLAVRPDRFVGLRHDGADAGVVRDYVDRLLA